MQVLAFKSRTMSTEGEAGGWRQRHPSTSGSSNDNQSNNNPTDNNPTHIRNIREEMEGFNRQRSSSSGATAATGTTRREEEDPDAGLFPPSEDLTSSSPWRGGRGGDLDAPGNDGRSRIIRRDSGSGRQEQKLVDLSTPTLVDEEDFYADEQEEQEMIRLEHERIRRHASAPIGAPYRTFFVHEDARRAPGAQVHKST